MSMLSGTLKNLGAMLTSNAVSVATELTLPFIFIHRYGNSLYAAWIALSAAVAYLGNLNFGVQTFVNQDLAVRYNRGERDSFHSQQSTALRILLGIAVGAALLCCVVFALPVERWLRLPLSHAATAWSMFFIALQVIFQEIIFGFFTGNFMIIGLAHRGTYWANGQRFTNSVMLVVLAWFRLPLPVLAGAQAALFGVFLLAVLVDLRRAGPQVFPSLRYWDRAAVKPILSKSGYFGLIVWSNFFCYQLPVILLERFAGDVPVVAFQLMRKLFGLGRQVLNGLTQSMGPEITGAYGRGDWDGMVKLYRVSERVIFTLIAVVNLPLFYFSPLLLLLWIHKGEYFSLAPYALIAALNTVLCVKEHKFVFQFSTNTHEKLANMMFFSYLGMALLSLFMIPRFGLSGFLATWLLVELGQTWSIVGMNASLFADAERLSHALLTRLCILASVGLAGGIWLLRNTGGWTLPGRLSVDITAALAVFAVSYVIFDVPLIKDVLKDKLSGRLRSN